MSTTTNHKQATNIKILSIPSTNYIYTIISILLQRFNVHSESELKTLHALYLYNTALPTNLTHKTRKAICQQSILSENALNQSLLRLEKKGVISRSGGTIFFHPCFTGLDDIDTLVFKLNKKKEEAKGGN